MLPAPQRAVVQEQFGQLIDSLNRLYGEDLRAKFVITLGDEFQAILQSPRIIPHLVWTLEERFQARQLRLGFGFGSIYTAIQEYAINVDGPSLHSARFAIEAAKRKDLRGGVFSGFGPVFDPVFNGFARVLYHQRASWPPRQREVARHLHRGEKGTDIAVRMGITKQAVSRYAMLAGWEAYREAEQGWTAVLETLPGHNRP